MKIISDKFLTGAMYAPFCRTMHAPMEVVSKLDVYMAYKAFKVFFEQK